MECTRRCKEDLRAPKQLCYLWFHRQGLRCRHYLCGGLWLWSKSPLPSYHVMSLQPLCYLYGCRSLKLTRAFAVVAFEPTSLNILRLHAGGSGVLPSKRQQHRLRQLQSSKRVRRLQRSICWRDHDRRDAVLVRSIEPSARGERRRS